MPDRPRVAVFAGSAFDATVRGILHELECDEVVVRSVEEAQKVDFDRLLLLGGRDISPFWYGEPKDGSRAPDIQRDFAEWALVRRALNRDVPVLGICRGMQLLAAACGGCLVQDLDAAGFREHPYNGGLCHKLYAVDDTLDRHLPHRKKDDARFVAVNSLHHQAVDRPPIGFRLTATAFDGVVESIYYPGMLGVQWHPEVLVETDERWMKLFRWFKEGLA